MQHRGASVDADGTTGPEASPRGDAGNIVGNVYDKYSSSNPIARALMSGFLDAVTTLYGSCAPRTALEVGCGEGHLANHLIRSGSRPSLFKACDLDLDQVGDDLDPEIRFERASIYDLPYGDGEFDIVICCEVLEHLERPAAGLAEVARVARNHVLISTPREPLWRALNLARGKYVSDLGNTPGHIQHFSRSGLRRLAERHMTITAQRSPVPWTILLGATGSSHRP